PEPGEPDRQPFLDTLAHVADLAKARGVTVAFETGQETADLLRRTLDELKCPNLKVNFDPANMLLYDKGDPLRAVEILGPDIRSVHVKDATRPPPPVPSFLPPVGSLSGVERGIDSPRRPAEFPEPYGQEQHRKRQPRTAALPGRSGPAEVLERRLVPAALDAATLKATGGKG